MSGSAAAAIIAQQNYLKKKRIPEYFKAKNALSNETAIEINSGEISDYIGLRVGENYIKGRPYIVKSTYPDKYYFSENEYIVSMEQEKRYQKITLTTLLIIIIITAILGYLSIKP